MANLVPRRTRGLNFLLGGTLVAAVFVAFTVLGGSFDIGLGAPSVRIDPPAVTRDVPAGAALAGAQR